MWETKRYVSCLSFAIIGAVVKKEVSLINSLQYSKLAVDESREYNGKKTWFSTCEEVCFICLFYCLSTARNCKELKDLGDRLSGFKQIAPGGDVGQGIAVYCDQTTDGGGWTQIQKRSTPFKALLSKTWADYEQGFGIESGGEHFWIGNKYLSLLTKSPVKLRIDVLPNGYAVYDDFSISGPEDNYRLHIGPIVSGNMNDAIHGDGTQANEQNGMPFSTSDRNNNGLKWCANINGPSGWWFNKCGLANLNQAYMPQWSGYNYYPMTQTTMKIRPMWSNGCVGFAVY